MPRKRKKILSVLLDMLIVLVVSIMFAFVFVAAVDAHGDMLCEQGQWQGENLCPSIDIE